MNRLLTFAATVEAATGLALMAVPAVVVRLLLGDEISGAAVSLGRVAGFGLLSLGLACWPGRGATEASAVRAILTYTARANTALSSLLARPKAAAPATARAAVPDPAMATKTVLARAAAALPIISQRTLHGMSPQARVGR
jgi:hypothetical protein